MKTDSDVLDDVVNRLARLEAELAIVRRQLNHLAIIHDDVVFLRRRVERLAGHYGLARSGSV